MVKFFILYFRGREGKMVLELGLVSCVGFFFWNLCADSRKEKKGEMWKGD